MAYISITSTMSYQPSYGSDFCWSRPLDLPPSAAGGYFLTLPAASPGPMAGKNMGKLPLKRKKHGEIMGTSTIYRILWGQSYPPFFFLDSHCRVPNICKIPTQQWFPRGVIYIYIYYHHIYTILSNVEVASYYHAIEKLVQIVQFPIY